MNGATIRAHAKINLGLKVLGRRPDGYHDLETVVQSISLHDTLEIEPAGSGLRLEVDDPGVPAGPENLVWRAAESLRRPDGRAGGLRIRLAKRIPVGAGLGGGSSDAAATLVALDRAWGLGLGPEGLASIAARLGSDVPYFLTGGTALLRGRGTEVRPLSDCGGYLLVVVFPGTPLPTRDVYAALGAALTPAGKISSMTDFGMIPDRDVESWVRLGNDLAAPARRLCSAIGEIEGGLRRCGATAVGVTGSGSAVFGVFRDGGDQNRAAGRMRDAGWASWRCEPLGAAEYRRGLGLA